MLHCDAHDSRSIVLEAASGRSLLGAYVVLSVGEDSSGSDGETWSNRVLAYKRILIVDDEEDARELLRRMLESWNVEVLDAPSVSEALTTLQSSHFDAIVSDIAMPDRDGYSLIREVRSWPPTASIPAIALTAFTRREDEARALREGFDLHFGKPFDSKRLLEALAGLVKNSAPPKQT